jgi:hypothetical protein
MSVLKNTFIMLDAIKSTSLDMYCAHIRSFARRYGPNCWAMLYQADHRGRLEQIPRIKRQGVIDHRNPLLISQDAGKACWHDDVQPWPCCFRVLTEDTAFVMREFIEPCDPHCFECFYDHWLYWW